MTEEGKDKRDIQIKVPKFIIKYIRKLELQNRSMLYTLQDIGGWARSGRPLTKSHIAQIDRVVAEVRRRG